MRVQQELEASELDPRAQNGSVESSIISVPDGPTLAAHEISTLSFTQAFAIYKVLQTSLCWALLRSISRPPSHWGPHLMLQSSMTVVVIHLPLLGMLLGSKNSFSCTKTFTVCRTMSLRCGHA